MITESAFVVFEDLKKAKKKLSRYSKLEYKEDSIRKKVIAKCTKIRGQIDSLQLLFTLPPSFTQYEVITPRVNNVLWQAYALIVNENQNMVRANEFAGSNAQQALRNADAFAKKVFVQVNSFYKNTWQTIPFDIWDTWEKPEKEFGNY